MFVLYVAVLLQLQFGTKFNLTIPQMSERKRKIERTLLLQSIIICGALQLETATFQSFQSLSLEGDASLYLHIFQNFCTILDSSVHPIVLFVFNADIRNGLAELITSQRKVFVQAFSIVPPNANLTTQSSPQQ
ncbi:hypothetical protein L596_013692 [Steinernema carpocapsae]|uniref:G-protein coupled receptors family 1 profile domain-containing protein n=1 Tax=Steinernema carpocapsae TaxID=34508 RepID=A0A4U5P1E5_STECR|nr:hypothetical protein L596_013692 [Steinernema carpocapsae]